MADQNREKPAILIIDMVKDNFDAEKNLPITRFAEAIIPATNRLIQMQRQGMPCLYALEYDHKHKACKNYP